MTEEIINFGWKEKNIILFWLIQITINKIRIPTNKYQIAHKAVEYKINKNNDEYNAIL